jgi:hypothetical protein
VTAAVLLRGGPTLFRLSPEADGVASLALGESPSGAAEFVVASYGGPRGERLVRWVREGHESEPLAVAEPELLDRLAAAGIPARAATSAELRRARFVLPKVDPGKARAFALALARARVGRALASDEEALIALAREEERVERNLLRETGALDQFLTAPTGPLAEYVQELTTHRADVEDHLARLEARLDPIARRVVPNLSTLLGPRVAARLVAAAGGRAALARIPSARLQILGARRRPAGGRGPRFGLLFRATRMTDVPPDRQGRLARSLAALAVIAVRADAFTGADLSAVLLPRRDRRIAFLARR